MEKLVVCGPDCFVIGEYLVSLLFVVDRRYRIVGVIATLVVPLYC
jgi:hypothetical protein